MGKVVTKFVIVKVYPGLYYLKDEKKKQASDSNWSAYLNHASTYKTYPEAEADLSTLPSNYYQIDKIFKVL